MDDEPAGGADEDDAGRSAVPAAGESATPDTTLDTPEPGSDPVVALDREEELQAVADDPTAGEPSATGDEADRLPGPGDEIIDLPWDEDLPVALGEETEARQVGDEKVTDGADDRPGEASDGNDDGDGDGDGDAMDEGDDLGELYDDDHVGGRRNALPRRVESWRGRTATGAIATAIAMGLQQVFEPERRRPAAVAEAPSDPYSDDDPITVDYVPDDAGATTVHVKPWLLQKGDPS